MGWMFAWTSFLFTSYIPVAISFSADGLGKEELETTKRVKSLSNNYCFLLRRYFIIISLSKSSRDIEIST